jgi:hypothetical protein
MRKILCDPVIPGRALRANPESITTDVAFGVTVAGTVVMDSGPAPKRAHPGMTNMTYGGRSRAAIQASARYAASIKASTPTIAMLPP